MLFRSVRHKPLLRHLRGPGVAADRQAGKPRRPGLDTGRPGGVHDPGGHSLRPVLPRSPQRGARPAVSGSPHAAGIGTGPAHPLHAESGSRRRAPWIPLNLSPASLNRLTIGPHALVVLAGVVAGTLDLASASTFWGTPRGLTPLQILQSVAAGWLGRATSERGYPSALLGLVYHHGSPQT